MHRRLLISMALAAAVASLHGQSGEPPAIAQGRALVAAINAGDDALRTFITANFSSSFLDVAPVEQHVKVLGGLRSIGTLTIEAVQPLARVETRLVLKGATSGERRSMRLVVEPDPPHRIRTISGGPAPPMAAAADASDTAMARALDAYLDGLCAKDGFSGTLIVAHEGKPLYQRACGLSNRADAVPMKIDTKLNLGSMNKMFTAVAIAQLVEAGQLAFDDPVGKHLPEYPDADVKTKVRIHHLLTHTSGLGSHFNEEFQNASRTKYRSVRDFMGIVEKQKLAFEPGTKWSYSNSGFMLLGAIVEKVSGKTYFDVVRQTIHEPAGMTNTDAFEMDDVVPNLAIGYVRDREGRWRNNLFMHVIKGGPAGGGFSTAPDLVKFAEALRAGKLVKPATLTSLLTPKGELKSPDYGYGFQIMGDGDAVGHSGGFPGISAQLVIYPKTAYAIAALSNYGASATAVVDQVRALLYQQKTGKLR